MKMNLTCIRCPNGCLLEVVKDKNGNIKVSGNRCPLGAEYGKQEMTDPRRIVTTIKQTKTGTISLKTDIAIKKGTYFDVLKQIDETPVTKKYKIGDVFIKNVCGSHSNIVVTGIHEEK